MLKCEAKAAALWKKTAVFKAIGRQKSHQTIMAYILQLFSNKDTL
jgi:hypothetical protein